MHIRKAPGHAGLARGILFLVVVGSSLHAALPQLAPPIKLDLFEAHAGGYAVYRVPGIVVTAKGSVLAYCETRRTGKTDWDAIDILLRRSTDGGRIWGLPQKMPQVAWAKTRNPVLAGYKLAKPDDLTYHNAVAIADRNGTVHFLFCFEYMRCFYLRSEDDGVTWSNPKEITSTFQAFPVGAEWTWKVIATGPGHGIQLRNGRLLVPVWLSTADAGGNGHRPSNAATIFSDDEGKTWRNGDVIWDAPRNASETVAVQLADGRVMLNMRNEAKENRRLITTSKDGATGWSKPRFDQALLEPICMGSILRVSEKPASEKNRIIFSNPANLSRADGKEAPGKPRDRRNLSIKLSYDEGETWPVEKVLEPGGSAYSDLALARDGTILCVYERASPAAPANASTGLLTLARFTVQWLTDGQDNGR